MLYNFQKFHPQDFILSHKTPFPLTTLLLPLSSPSIAWFHVCESVDSNVTGCEDPKKRKVRQRDGDGDREEERKGEREKGRK